MQRKNLHQSSAIVLLLFLLIISLLGGQSVSAQKQITRIQITSVDDASFPEVNVRVQIYDSDDNLVHDPLQANAFTFLEDGKPQAFEIKTEIANVQTMFVVDIGAGINALGASGQSRLNEMLEVMVSYFERMRENDEVGIVIQTGNGSKILTPLISDKDLLNNSWWI